MFQVDYEGATDIEKGEPAEYTLEIGVLGADKKVKTSTSVTVKEAGTVKMDYELKEGESLFISKKYDASL